MLLLLQSLEQTKDGRLHAVNFAKRLKEWSAIGLPELGTPPRGIGYTVGSTLSHLGFKINPHKAAFDIWNARGRNLAANGAVMRTSVLGIESFWDESRVVENALAAAKVTHADPRSIVSAVISSVLISRLLRGGGQSITDDAARTWNSRLAQHEYREELLEYLRRGSDIHGEQSSNPEYEPETPDSAFKIKDQKALLNARKEKAAMKDTTGSDSTPQSSFKVSVIDKLSQFIMGPTPQRSSDDRNKDRQRPVVRDDIGWAGMDNVGEHNAMSALARSVLDDYKFLLLETDVIPFKIQINRTIQSATGNEGGEEEEERQAHVQQQFQDRIQDKWFHELESACFPKHLDDLELGDQATMGYAFKCIGIGYYSATRQLDPAAKIANYKGPAGLFRGILEQVTLEAGDADTNGAVVGSLLGARLGIKEGIPESWWAHLRHFEWLDETIDRFITRVMARYEEHERQQQQQEA
ncbi:hypothetical protein BGZ51_002334 [Haplosporangium sp. Z 767]|nr:hypothetical protein BGZ51_002334 [Haplosporangium sp. Z 767]